MNNAKEKSVTWYFDLVLDVDNDENFGKQLGFEEWFMKGKIIFKV